MATVCIHAWVLNAKTLEVGGTMVRWFRYVGNGGPDGWDAAKTEQTGHCW